MTAILIAIKILPPINNCLYCIAIIGTISLKLSQFCFEKMKISHPIVIAIIILPPILIAIKNPASINYLSYCIAIIGPPIIYCEGLRGCDIPRQGIDVPNRS